MEKEKIIKAATALFFKYGIRSVSMDDLAKELGMSKKTIYVHFKDKDELLKAAMLAHDEAEKEILKSFQQEATNAIDEMLRIAQYVERMLKQVSPTMLYDMQKYHREAWELMNKMHNEDIYKEILMNIERGIKEDLYRKDFNIDIVSKIYVNTAANCANSDLFPPNQYNMNDIVQTNIMYHLRGIVTHKGLALLEQ
jgi:TetR/AcrR family transcriptional regulator, cholesterol catabolism regulator